MSQKGAYLAIPRMNLVKRGSIVEACDMLDRFSGVAIPGRLATGGNDLQSKANCRWTACTRLPTCASRSCRFLALSLCDCIRRRFNSASSCRRLFWDLFGIQKSWQQCARMRSLSPSGERGLGMSYRLVLK